MSAGRSVPALGGPLCGEVCHVRGVGVHCTPPVDGHMWTVINKKNMLKVGGTNTSYFVCGIIFVGSIGGRGTRQQDRTREIAREETALR